MKHGKHCLYLLREDSETPKLKELWNVMLKASYSYISLSKKIKNNTNPIQYDINDSYIHANQNNSSYTNNNNQKEQKWFKQKKRFKYKVKSTSQSSSINADHSVYSVLEDEVELLDKKTPSHNQENIAPENRQEKKEQDKHEPRVDELSNTQTATVNDNNTNNQTPDTPKDKGPEIPASQSNSSFNETNSKTRTRSNSKSNIQQAAINNNNIIQTNTQNISRPEISASQGKTSSESQSKTPSNEVNSETINMPESNSNIPKGSSEMGKSYEPEISSSTSKDKTKLNSNSNSNSNTNTDTKINLISENLSPDKNKHTKDENGKKSYAAAATPCKHHKEIVKINLTHFINKFKCYNNNCNNMCGNWYFKCLNCNARLCGSCKTKAVKASGFYISPSHSPNKPSNSYTTPKESPSAKYIRKKKAENTPGLVQSGKFKSVEEFEAYFQEQQDSFDWSLFVPKPNQTNS